MNIIDFNKIPIIKIILDQDTLSSIYLMGFDYSPHLSDEIQRKLDAVHESFITDDYDDYDNKISPQSKNEMNREIIEDFCQKVIKPYLFSLKGFSDFDKTNFYFYVNGILKCDYSYKGLIKYLESLCDIIIKSIVHEYMTIHAVDEEVDV